MATPAQIADRALELAGGFLSASRDEIASMAGDDGHVLYEASQVVRERADSEIGGHSAHSAEHLAFSLITAAHDLLRRRQSGTPTPPG